jgi:hypothetical protein
MKKIIFLLLAGLSFTHAIAEDSSSKITIKNSSSSTQQVTGIYVQRLATGNSCDVLAGNTNTPTHGTSWGALWKKMTFASGDTQTLGANYLYQMVHHLLYQTYLGGANCTPGVGQCAMFTSNPNTNKWCINLGIIKGPSVRVSGAISGSNDLLSLAESTQIKITCDDSKLTCTANTSVSQNF